MLPGDCGELAEGKLLEVSAVEEELHEVGALFDVEVGVFGVLFREGGLEEAAYAGAGHGEAGGFVAVFASGNVGGMVGNDEESPVGEGAEFFEDWGDDEFVDVFDGGDLGAVIGLV